MDSHGDGILHAVLEQMKGECTMILVSHRPTTLGLADRVYEVTEGHLVERTDFATGRNHSVELRKPA
jgi:ABC-type bacteriocin/lantibiotic exporter with double-glycine peptidase domain